MRVDLPEPLAPSSACTSPGRTSNVTSSRAFCDGKVFDTCSAAMAGTSRVGLSGLVSIPSATAQSSPRVPGEEPGARGGQLGNTLSLLPPQRLELLHVVLDRRQRSLV